MKATIKGVQLRASLRLEPPAELLAGIDYTAARSLLDGLASRLQGRASDLARVARLRRLEAWAFEQLALERARLEQLELQLAAQAVRP